MSTSIYRRIDLGLCKSSSDIRKSPYRNEARRVKRVLFESDEDKDIKHAQTQAFINEEFKKINTIMSKRWNFNFITEDTLDPNGQYVWKPFTPQKQRKLKQIQPIEPDISDLYAPSVSPIKPKAIKPIEYTTTSTRSHQRQSQITGK